MSPCAADRADGASAPPTAVRRAQRWPKGHAARIRVVLPDNFHWSFGGDVSGAKEQRHHCLSSTRPAVGGDEIGLGTTTLKVILIATTRCGDDWSMDAACVVAVCRSEKVSALAARRDLAMFFGFSPRTIDQLRPTAGRQHYSQHDQSRADDFARPVWAARSRFCLIPAAA